jgi:hypothetical protein
MKPEDSGLLIAASDGEISMAITSMFGKKAAAAALAVLTFGAGMSMNSSEAEARYGRKGLVAAGVIGALVTGAIVASAANAHANPHHYYDDGVDAGYVPAPVYHAPQPVYYHRPQTQFYGHPGHYYGHPGWHHQQRRAHRRQHGYSETGFAYRGPVCKLQRQQVWTGYGYQVQRVEVCR